MKSVVKSKIENMIKLLFSIFPFFLFLSSFGSASYNLCLYTEEDDICSSSLFCQEFELGICSRYSNYSILLGKLNENEYTLINYSSDCRENELVSQLDISLGVCEMYNFSQRITLTRVGKQKTLPGYVVFIIIVSSVLMLAGVYYIIGKACRELRERKERREKREKEVTNYELNKDGHIVQV